MPGITACVITRNEEHVIERCLRSLKFADEIVVVDAGSTDRTTELARQLGAKVVTQAWRGFAPQRNTGLDQSSHPWVFFLDADEEATPELGARLRRIAEGSPADHPNCYSIKRIEYFLGRRLDHGPGNPSFQWRFFKKQGVRFEGEVHEFPNFAGAVGLIDDAAIHHLPDLGIDRFLSKLNHYTTLEALDRFGQGQRTTLAHAVLTFFSTFAKNGIRYGGLRNGKEGFVLTLLESFSRVVRHLKLWVFWQVHDGRIKMNLGVRLPEPGSVRPPSRAELERPVWEKR
jgi:glycosyltransferase involved in cell wall biosynthesis